MLGQAACRDQELVQRGRLERFSGVASRHTAACAPLRAQGYCAARSGVLRAKCLIWRGACWMRCHVWTGLQDSFPWTLCSVHSLTCAPPPMCTALAVPPLLAAMGYEQAQGGWKLRQGARNFY
mmetsp:Transcript_39154/g.98032  ORF Transcript_39154/g.98032 Transcript_39154/m.98032 type:complete len:123 (+) Transcript_39154:123-491(+)